MSLNPLRVGLCGAGLARAGAALALLLGAAQAGATTYTVPLQFNLTLDPPLCSLTVGGVTANAGTPTPTTGPVVNLTPTAGLAADSSQAFVERMAGLEDTTGAKPGLIHASAPFKSRRMLAPPTVSVTCTADTVMTAKLERAAKTTNTWAAKQGGKPGEGQAGTLPIGMTLGIASFAGQIGVTPPTPGSNTDSGSTSFKTVTASGSAQPLIMEVVIYGSNTSTLTASHAGLWLYEFSVSLEF